MYTGLILPRVIFPLLHLKTVSLRLEFAQTSCVLKEIIWDVGIRPVLNLPADNESKRGENKTRANISLYTVNKLQRQSFPHLHVFKHLTTKYYMVKVDGAGSSLQSIVNGIYPGPPLPPMFSDYY